jgi:hypothetical protein
MRTDSSLCSKQNGQASFDYELFEMDRSVGRATSAKTAAAGSLGPAPKILGVGMCIMIVTALRLSYGQNNNNNDDISGPTPLLSKWLFADDSSSQQKHHRPPPPVPQQMDALCGRYNVQYARGAKECERVCAAARCCHDVCWPDNKSVCLQYHHHCSILDKGHNHHGKQHGFLPKGYKAKWFGDAEGDLNHGDDVEEGSSGKNWKNVFAKRTTTHHHQYKPASSVACHSLESNPDNLGNCIRQCLPATCCFPDENAHDKDSQPKVCSSLGGKMVTCADYQQCAALF